MGTLQHMFYDLRRRLILAIQFCISDSAIYIEDVSNE